MPRQITVTDELAEALENAATRDEDGNQVMTGATSMAAALGGGLLSLLPTVLTIVTTLIQSLGKGNTLALLQALPALLAAVQAGDWNKVIEIITKAFGVPMPTKGAVIGSMPE